MTVERDLSFVDTNVLVYAFDRSSSPKKRAAQRLLNELNGRGHNSVTGYETLQFGGCVACHRITEIGGMGTRN